MRRRMAPVALAVAVPAALTAAAGGSVLGAASPAAAAVPSATAARCTDTWVGKALRPLWTLARNWSNGVPGRSSDVCITLTGAEVSTGVSVKIHSLQLGQADSLALAGNDVKRVTATVATFVDLTPGGTSLLSMNNATVKAAKIDNQGGTIFTVGACDLDSPDVVLGQGATMKDASGTTTLQSLPQLSNGTLTGASFTTETSDTFFVLPGDITHLVSSAIDLSGGSAIQDPNGNDALAGLTSVGAQSSLEDGSNLALTGSSFTADGNVTFSGAVSLAGPYTQAAGTLSLLGIGVLSASPVTIAGGAALSGAGVIGRDLVNDGTVRPSGGTIQVDGSYTQGTNAVLESGFGDTLAVSRVATLAGEAALSRPGTPPGNESPLITFGSLSGNFTSHSLGISLFTKVSQIDARTVPQIAVSPAAVTPGGAVTVTGASFNVQATIFLDHVTGTPLATVVVPDSGAFSVPVMIPVTAKDGRHTLIAVGDDGSRASVMITVS